MYVALEFVEGAAIDARKEFSAEFGATTACTLRLVKRYKGSNKVIIGDSWFGSKKTVEELGEWDLYGIFSVKNAHRGFPKRKLLDSI